MIGKLTIEPLQPLRAESLERMNGIWSSFMGDEYKRRAESLYAQLKDRPSTWGIGLWGNDHAEKIAKRCAEIFAVHFMRCPNDHLIPQDRMCMIGALDDLGDLDGIEAIAEIEGEFECRIPEELCRDERLTFSGFVEYILKEKGKMPTKQRQRKGRLEVYFSLFVLVFGVCGVLAAFAFSLYSVYCDILDLRHTQWHWFSLLSIAIRSLVTGIFLFGIIWAVLWTTLFKKHKLVVAQK